MRMLTRCAAPYVIALAVVLLAATASAAETHWPSLFNYTISLSTDETARWQTGAALMGRISDDFGAKIQGWWTINTVGPDRSFAGDMYVDYNRAPLYLAVGRKYTAFGPAGLLVSPGFFGGELGLRFDRVTAQIVTGSLQFRPGTGTTRFTYTGNRVPLEESFSAARFAFVLTGPDADVPVTLGLNGIDVLDDTGSSVDASFAVTKWLTLYGEAASYDDEDAHAYGIRLSDAEMRSDGRAMIAVWYRRDVPVNFVPAAIGASSYFENMVGWAGGLYYQFNPNRAVGIFSDGEDAILTLFGNVPL